MVEDGAVAAVVAAGRLCPIRRGRHPDGRLLTANNPVMTLFIHLPSSETENPATKFVSFLKSFAYPTKF
jgi:hypothetical protein